MLKAQVKVSWTPSVSPNIGKRTRVVKVNGTEVFNDELDPGVSSFVVVGLGEGDLLDVTTTVYSKDDAEILATAHATYTVPQLTILPDTDFQFQIVSVAEDTPPATP